MNKVLLQILGGLAIVVAIFLLVSVRAKASPELYNYTSSDSAGGIEALITFDSSTHAILDAAGTIHGDPIVDVIPIAGQLNNDGVVSYDNTAFLVPSEGAYPYDSYGWLLKVASGEEWNAFSTADVISVVDPGYVRPESNLDDVLLESHVSFTPLSVPEPISIALFAAGVAIACAFARRHKRSPRAHILPG